VDVDRVVLDARVLDASGDALLGLEPSDFRVTVDGREVPLESVEWVSARRSPASDDAGEGRLLVVLVQKDLNHLRAPGMLATVDRVREMARRLGDRDRVAVVAHDSRLRLWTDFTNDRARVEEGLTSVLVGGPPAEERGSPSLAEHLDPAAADEAASLEDGITVLARALRRLPGPKAVVLIGHGFWGIDDVARRMLEDARAPVFALDVTDADHHDLEWGLQDAADQTGGFYARARPGHAIGRLEAAIAGHYVLTFPRPVLPIGEHAVTVELVGRRGTVLAKKTYRG
jgi:VWFA-related protein